MAGRTRSDRWYRPDLPQVIIGSDLGCDLVVHDDQMVAPHHCKVVRVVPANPVNGAPPVFELHDLGSSTGTYLIRAGRRRRITWATLVAGDLIVVGSACLPWTGAAR